MAFEKTFVFRINRNLTLLHLKIEGELEKISHNGIWPIRYTRIFTKLPGWNNNKTFKLWFTTKKEHEIVVKEIYEWLRGEEFIEKL